MAECSSCGAEIRWADLNGRPHPFDAEPVKVQLYRLDNGYAVRPAPLYQSHFASCPNAAQHRKR